MFIIDFILHIDQYINILIQNFGSLTYFILFIIIFLETGVIVTPFLPGDSLIFIAGAFAAQGSLNVVILFFVLSIAAILGDSLNYSIGNYLGEKIEKNKSFIKPEHLQKTQNFYKKHGIKTIILARFVPIVRTIAPFVAGVGKMNYKKFLTYNIIGGLLWVTLFLFAGYFFGGIPFIEDNLNIIIIVILVLSVMPPIIDYIRYKRIK